MFPRLFSMMGLLQQPLLLYICLYSIVSLRECPSVLKSYEFVKFANKLKANKVVSKKFGDVKKIPLFERANKPLVPEWV